MTEIVFVNGETPAKPRKSRAERATEAAGALIVAMDGDDRAAAAALKRVMANGSATPPRVVLVVMAIIAAGALKQVHGDQWKDHVTEYPDNLNQEDA